MTTAKTGERMVPELYRSEADYILYLRHLFAYETAAGRLRPSDAVLDIGCGAGYGTSILSRHSQHAIGVDVSADTIRSATAAYGSEVCSFSTYDGAHLPFADGRFDAATSFQTIEHVSADQQFVAEAARVLKRGALFVLTTPNRTTRLRENQPPWNRFHVREYSARQLESLLAAHFTTVDLLGVRASARIEAVENARVESAQRLVSLDPLGLRRFAAPIAAWLARLRPAPATGMWAHRVADFYATPEERDAGCDLLAICRR